MIVPPHPCSHESDGRDPNPTEQTQGNLPGMETLAPLTIFVYKWIVSPHPGSLIFVKATCKAQMMRSVLFNILVWTESRNLVLVGSPNYMNWGFTF